jgi:tRNA pseudouridine55 synthase
VFSAKKVHGTPMHRLARRQRPVFPVATPVTFRRIALLGMEGSDLEIEADVSAGTYLRSFAHDLGVALGCGGHLHALRRVAAGPFGVEEAVPLGQIQAEGPAVASRVLPLDRIPLGMPTLQLSAAGVHAVRHGRPCGVADVVTPPPPFAPGRCRLQGPEGGLVAIAEIDLAAGPGPRPLIRPQIVFHR